MKLSSDLFTIVEYLFSTTEYLIEHFSPSEH